MENMRPRGTNDILPDEVVKWQHIEKVARNLCINYNYKEIRTPIFEHTELFERGVGDATDIVEKEMYTFKDRKNRSITLRPEGTAPSARAYLESRLKAGPQPVKLFYIGPMFRYDRPQSGRYRQFHQFGIEVFGSKEPEIDAEVIAMAMDFYKKLGLSNLELHINSVGCPICRPYLQQNLKDFFSLHLDNLCNNCIKRLDRNPLRVIDCKECREIGKDAPTIVNYLCENCLNNFRKVKKYLNILEIPFKEDNHLVRGLDYYTNTAFEIMVSDIGAQSSIGGGGRYNGLVETIGGPQTPGIGFAIGLERVLLAMENQGAKFPKATKLDVFIAKHSENNSFVENKVIKLLFKLRDAGISADMDYINRSLNSQMRYAGKIGAKFVIIIGEEEFKSGLIKVRDMDSGDEKSFNDERAIVYIILTKIKEEFYKDIQLNEFILENYVLKANYIYQKYLNNYNKKLYENFLEYMKHDIISSYTKQFNK